MQFKPLPRQEGRARAALKKAGEIADHLTGAAVDKEGTALRDARQAIGYMTLIGAVNGAPENQVYDALKALPKHPQYRD